MITKKGPEQKYLHFFKVSVEKIDHPEAFTYPFFYEAHPLAAIAADEVQFYLKNQNDFDHDFGFDSDFQQGIGKMFGVLVVQKRDGDIGYLAGFSGKLANSNKHDYFVPPIFDILDENGFFVRVEEEINQLTYLLDEKKSSEFYHSIKEEVKRTRIQFSQELEQLKATHRINKQQRDQIRKSSPSSEVLLRLRNESIEDSYVLKKFKKQALSNLETLLKSVRLVEDEINEIRQFRKEKSSQLQNRIFQHYKILNANRESKDLMDVFADFNGDIPPAGSGECAAPKLLNYAFKNNLKPLCMAEFWWGRPPSSEVRKHGDFYPACRSKCEPILSFMLQGLKLDENPIARNYGQGKEIEIIHEDEDLIVVNKPEGLLSVPGKVIEDSVAYRLKTKYPMLPDLILVHRLDMSTSGLIVVAKNLKAHKYVQRQFIKRTVEKRYIAILDGEINLDKGSVNLPIRVDLDNRPRQLVCYDYGKKALTEYEIIKAINGKTRIYFYPKTGRTHQLRLHAAHKLGLSTPIMGDDLYGNKRDRLYLHAEKISFIHPTSRVKINFTAPPDF